MTRKLKTWRESTTDELLRERAGLVRMLRDLDEELASRGVLPAERVPRGATMADRVVALIGAGIGTAPDLAAKTGQGEAALHQMLHQLMRRGRVVRVRHGLYGLPQETS